jgi:hypothetical protein
MAHLIRRRLLETTVVPTPMRETRLKLSWGWALKSALLIVPLAPLITYEVARLVTALPHTVGPVYGPFVLVVTIGPAVVFAVVQIRKYRRLTWQSVAATWAVAFMCFFAYGLLFGVM